MFCQHCGGRLGEAANFCQVCGEKRPGQSAVTCSSPTATTTTTTVRGHSASSATLTLATSTGSELRDVPWSPECIKSLEKIRSKVQLMRTPRKTVGKEVEVHAHIVSDKNKILRKVFPEEEGMAGKLVLRVRPDSSSDDWLKEVEARFHGLKLTPVMPEGDIFIARRLTLNDLRLQKKQRKGKVLSAYFKAAGRDKTSISNATKRTVMTGEMPCASHEIPAKKQKVVVIESSEEDEDMVLPLPMKNVKASEEKDATVEVPVEERADPLQNEVVTSEERDSTVEERADPLENEVMFQDNEESLREEAEYVELQGKLERRKTLAKERCPVQGGKGKKRVEVVYRAHGGMAIAINLDEGQSIKVNVINRLEYIHVIYKSIKGLTPLYINKLLPFANNNTYNLRSQSYRSVY